MDIQTLISFFMWCSILNGGLLTLWTLAFMAVPDWVYQLQHRWFPIPRETFNTLFYGFLGLFKILFLFFNLVPYLVLIIMAE